jgi:hypothetical protein
MIQNSHAWTPPKRLTWNTGDSLSPEIAIDTNNVIHIVWYDGTPAVDSIYYKNSTDLGVTWSLAKRISWTAKNSWGPVVATDGDNTVHVVWYEGDLNEAHLLYRKSTNNGVTWSATKRLTWQAGRSFYPKIAIGPNDYIHIVWHFTYPYSAEIFYRRSLDGGNSFSALKRLTWTTEYSGFSDIDVDSKNQVHIVWTEFFGGSKNIFYKRSLNAGKDWSARTRLTWNSGVDGVPEITIGPTDNIHLFWQDFSPTAHWASPRAEIYYKKSTNEGLTWTGAQRLNWLWNVSGNPSACVTSTNNVYVFWDTHYDYFLYTSGEIYYKQSTNGGNNWFAASLFTWTTTVTDQLPSIARDSNNDIHVVWSRMVTLTNEEIFYKKGK